MAINATSHPLATRGGEVAPVVVAGAAVARVATVVVATVAVILLAATPVSVWSLMAWATSLRVAWQVSRRGRSRLRWASLCRRRTEEREGGEYLDSNQGDGWGKSADSCL